MEVKKSLFLALALLLLSLPVKAQPPSGSIFALQCHDVISAKVDFFRERVHVDGTVTYRVLRRQVVRDLERLVALEVSTGVWYGYDSPHPFGGTYPDEQAGSWQSRLITQTSCGEFLTIAWDNGDGTLILFAFYDFEVKCDANGNHCGTHNFEFYYVTIEEWMASLGE